MLLLSIANLLISGDPGFDVCNHWILLVILSYSLFLAFFLPFSNFCLTFSINVSSSLRTMLASKGLRTLSCGVPSDGIISLPFSGSM